MKKKILILTVIFAIIMTGCSSPEQEEREEKRMVTFVREYGLPQLKKEKKTIVNKHENIFLLYVKSKEVTSERQDLNFFYTLENRETREAVFKDIDINKISYVFIEEGEKPKLEVEFKSGWRKPVSEIEDLKEDVHIFNVKDFNFKIKNFKFYIPQEALHKSYQVN